MSILVRDLRYAFRAFAKSPGFTLAAILSLAIGIGANTAIFSIMSALLLRPLPYQDSDRLVIMWNTSPGLGITRDWFSTAQYFDIKNNHHGFEQVAIAIGGSYNLTGDGDPERVGVTRVSHELLPMLGAKAYLGRLFTPEDDKTGSPNVAILSYGMSARRYGSEPKLVGRQIIINSHLYQVVEVLPTLEGTDQSDVLIPMRYPPNSAEDRGHEDYNVLGKLRPGVSLEQVRAEMDTITARLRQARS